MKHNKDGRYTDRENAFSQGNSFGNIGTSFLLLVADETVMPDGGSLVGFVSIEHSRA